MTLTSVFYMQAIVDGKLVALRLPADALAARRPATKDNDVTITDTARLSSAEKLAIAATPGGVIAQERRGQQELVASDQLPSDGLLGPDRARWEALGLKILDEGSDDPMFCRVELPTGWRKVPREHALWTDLVDGDGQIRAEIRYKAAFYDRYADVRLKDPEPKIDCVCGECGHEQDSMDPCAKCGSLRTVLLSVVVREFGENWRETCFPDDSDKESP
jgi:hypothetical protein